MARYLTIALVIAGLWLDSASANDTRTERIQFARGTSGITISGTIRGYEIVDYLLAAAAGQTLRVTISTDNLANYFNIIPPDSADVADFVGSASGDTFEGALDLDGDWKVRVYLYRAAARRNEMANFTLDLAITGAPDPAAAREANDFGPRTFDVRGVLYCALGDATLDLACPFKVIRSSGGASVFTRAPGGRGERVLYFEDPDWSTNSAAQVSSSKSGDMWRLAIEGETYEFPDAVIYGG